MFAVFYYQIIAIINVFRKMEVRDKRRWGLADENGDGSLTKNEFKHFLHPEEVDHMKELVVQETIDDIDKVRTKIMKDQSELFELEIGFIIRSFRKCV